MSMTFLIDGYNLLHALGLANRQMARGELQRARLRLLDWLGDGHPGATVEVRVIFDAVNAPGPGSGEQDHRGVRARYAVGRLADDLIEEQIAAEPQPKRLTVVSNDHRLQDAACPRDSRAWG